MIGDGNHANGDGDGDVDTGDLKRSMINFTGAMGAELSLPLPSLRSACWASGLPLWELAGKNLEPIWKGKIEVALDSLFTACADKI